MLAISCLLFCAIVQVLAVAYVFRTFIVTLWWDMIYENENLRSEFIKTGV